MASPEARPRRTPTRSTIRRRVDGGFQVVRGKAVWMVATPAPGGLRVTRGRSGRWFLARAELGDGAGFVLSTGSRRNGPEAARSTRLPLAAGLGLAGTHLVAADGRCFALIVDLEAGLYRLMSWDGFGPYARVARRGAGWSFDVTPAGESLLDDAELVAVLAAELLEETTDRGAGKKKMNRRSNARLA